MKMASLQASLEEAFRRLEKAIDAHNRLERVNGPQGEPDMRYSRLGGTISILVKLKGSRKRPTKITGNGDTLDAALEDLVNGLDTWAEAIA
jgi:predicted RNase H-like HicB family nuclease